MIKTEPIENSKSDRRLAEKELQITRKLPQLVGKWVRLACVQWRDATKGVPNAVNRGRNACTEGRNTIWKGRNASLCFSLSTTLFCAFQYLLGRTAIFRDEQPICSTVLGRTTASWDQRRFWASASNDKRLAEKEPQITRKLPQLVGKLVRSAFDERRDAANAMPKAVNRGRNAGTEGRNTIWRGRNTILDFSFSTAWFCAFQYLLGRTAEIRDQLPIYSAVPGRTTASWDERRDLACASNDRRPASFMARNAAKATRNAGKSARTAFFGKCSVTTYMPTAVNSGRNTGTEGRTAIFRDKLPICSSVPGRTTVNRDEFSFCTLFFVKSSFFKALKLLANRLEVAQKGTQKLLAANLLSKVAQLLSFYYPKFWRPVIRCRAHVPSRSCCGWFGKSRWSAEGGRRDATKGMPNAVKRGRNAFNGERNAKKFGRNASALKRGAIPSRDRFFGSLCKWALHALKPCTAYLITLKILFCVCLAHARQSSFPEAAHGVALSTDSIKPLKIGDSIPEALWNLPLQVVNHPEGKDTITLNDYRNSKLIVLEFWATYCHPCIRSIEKFDSIRQRYTADELMLLPVQVYDDVDRALPFLEKHGWKLSSVVGDTLMNKGYFSRYLTGFGIVWIADGRLMAVPSIKSINATNVDRAIRRQPLRIINRKEQALDQP